MTQHNLASKFLLLALFAAPCAAQLPVFPGAEGYGGTFNGMAPVGGWFANASVYHVTTTADTINATTGKPDVGTLRGAFYDYTNPNSPKQGVKNRVVVFDVGGVFQLTQGSLDIKTVENIYVAGQTAPSPVTVYGDTTQITKSNNTITGNVALRYMTFRKGVGDGEDAITFSGGSGTGSIASNMILDHVSASWAEDEDLSVANNNTNVTVQYSIIADALTSGHAYGSLIRPQIDSSVSFHHNLYANNASRQARFGTYNAETLTADFRNNVIYNWRDRASYTGGSSEAEQEYTDVNYVGNYLVAGSGTVGSANRAFSVDKNVDSRVYQSGNFIDSDKALNPGGVPNGSDLGWAAFQVSTPVTDQTLTQMASPFATSPVTTQTAPNAFNQVLSHVGNYWWQREAIDARIINNVETNTGPPGGIAAAAPGAAELAALLATPTTTRAAGYDTDNDGMPNSWELAHGLNPNLASDAFGDFDADGYVNVIEHVNDAGAFPAPTPIKFVGAGIARYALANNWRTDDGGITTGTAWQPSWYDAANIASGTVVVDAVGQHAGDLKLGLAAADAPTLTISNGWLNVADTLTIGGHASSAAQLNVSGGELTVASLQKGAAGSFALTGGELHANQVGFSLTNNGGRIAPGSSVGATAVTGDLSLTTGTLEIELASASSFDQVSATGALTLGGALDVIPLGGYAPVSGSWLIGTASSVSGAFSSVTSGYSVRVSGGNVFLDFGSLPGDFNSDGHVDAADYTVWRDTLSVSNPGGYAIWAANFNAGAAAASPSSSAVPEPSSLIVLIATLAGLVLCSKHSGVRNLE